MTRQRDFYEILGVSSDSPQEVIDAAYRALMRKYHPDTQADGRDALGRAREINEAYQALSNPAKRRKYDNQRDRSRNMPAQFTEVASSNELGSSAYSGAESQRFKRCIDCAEEIQLGARVCRYCSARQDEGQKAQSQRTNIHTHVYPTAPPPPPLEPGRKRGNGGLLIFGIILALIFLLIIGLASGSENEAPNEPSELGIAENLAEAAPELSTADANEAWLSASQCLGLGVTRDNPENRLVESAQRGPILSGFSSSGELYQVHSTERCRLIAEPVFHIVTGEPEPTREEYGDHGRFLADQKTSPAQNDTALAIPAPFLGEWNQTLNECGNLDSSSRLVIEPKQVRFYESVGDVQKVAHVRPGAITVEVTVSGEGQVWTDKLQMALSKSGRDLVIAERGTRHRC